MYTDSRINTRSFELKSNVKKLTTKNYLITKKGNEIVEKLVNESTSIFDREGYLNEVNTTTNDSTFKELYTINKERNQIEIKKYRDGELESMSVNKYDSQGRKIEVYINDNNFVSISRSEYDVSGFMVMDECILYELKEPTKQFFQECDKDSIIVYHKNLIKYNEQGKKTEITTLDKDGVLLSTVNYIYDDKGNLITQDYDNPSEDVFERTDFQYDNHGNMIETQTIDGDDNVTKEATWKYDKHGNMVECQSIDLDSYTIEYSVFDPDTEEYVFDSENNDSCIIEITSCKYDNQGKKVEEIVHDDKGVLKRRTNYCYDEKDILVNEIFVSPENNNKPIVTNYQTEYDNHDNWIKKVVKKITKETVETDKSIRDIEYYPNNTSQ